MVFYKLKVKNLGNFRSICRNFENESVNLRFYDQVLLRVIEAMKR